MTEEQYALKDALFNTETLKLLTDFITDVYKPFDQSSFYNEIITEMMPL